MFKKLSSNGRQRACNLLSLQLFNLLLVLAQISNGQRQAGNNETPARRVTDSGALGPPPDSANASDLVLLSGEEFVDEKEVATLLFDGLSNESAADENKNQTESSQTPSSNSTTKITTTTTNTSANAETSTPLTTSAENATKSTETEDSSNKTSADEGAEEEGEEGPQGGDNSDDSSKFPDSESAFEPPQNVSQYMDYIEKLFHDLKHQISDIFEPHIPQLIRTSQMVELSSSCSYDMLRIALALRQFEPWALRMIDSSGKVPEGIFEGTFTALGSYDECLNTIFQSTSSHMLAVASTPSQTGSVAQDRAPPTQGKYCLVTLSPFLPPKPPSDRIELMFQAEANRRNYTKDNQFSRLSPMFYYMKFRIGVCIPSTCNQGDMDSISSALSSSLRLNITIPDCHVRHSYEPLSEAQLNGGLIFGGVLAIVLGATLIEYCQTKLNKIERLETRLKNQVESADYALGGTKVVAINKSEQLGIKMHHVHENQAAGVSKPRFEQRLEQHWTWMSFSLITNFHLHFKDASKRPMNESDTQFSRGDRTPSALRGQIHCLNGIRVLSLCWVIVANSYLTLDPRATKRLTKTREAPRDFLFQLIVQASLAIETFFFLSGLLMSLSFARRLKSAGDASRKDGEKWNCPATTLVNWIHFYLHRFVRLTAPTMLVIAFSMYAYHFGDGPLWFEATQRVHQSCSQNWWRHLLHVANFVDTRQMCSIHYWYIAADMQLFLFAPLIMLSLYKCRHLGYALIALIGTTSMGLLFYITYNKNLPPTLLFYDTDPESRREFGNTIMTKPFTHVLPYLVGMLVGWCLLNNNVTRNRNKSDSTPSRPIEIHGGRGGKVTISGVCGLIAICIALAELFLPYKWNNSHLPSKMIASIYAAVFRLGWSLVLAYIVITCRHKHTNKCTPNGSSIDERRRAPWSSESQTVDNHCFCSSGGGFINRLLSLNIFNHLSKLSFVAYLIHLPLMSVFIGQTRGLFSFSHMLVIHFAVSYLVMAFTLSFVLVHIIEFPFLTFERLLFDRLLPTKKPVPSSANSSGSGDGPEKKFQKLKTIPGDALANFNLHSLELTGNGNGVVANRSSGRRSSRPDSGDSMFERL